MPVQSLHDWISWLDFIDMKSKCTSAITNKSFCEVIPEKRFRDHKRLRYAVYYILGIHSACQYLQSSVKSYTKN